MLPENQGQDEEIRLKNCWVLILLTVLYGAVLAAQQDSFNITVTVQSTSPPTVEVTSPNGGERWQVGWPHNITWTPYGTADAVVKIYSWRRSVAVFDYRDGRDRVVSIQYPELSDE